MTFTGKKGNGIIIFSDNEVENLTIKYRARTREDIINMENSLLILCIIQTVTENL